MRRLTGLLMTLVILITGSITMIDAKSVEATIEYTFSGADRLRAGYAQGEVTLSAPDGDYLLYWADDDAALDGYYPIAGVEVRSGRGGYSFGERVAIPIGARRLIAVPDGVSPDISSAAAVFDLPSYKQLLYTDSDRIYRAGVMSDIHIDEQDGGINTYYTNASANFMQALNVSQLRKADFIVTTGDQITNASGATLEWQEYQRILAESDYDGPVYEAIGNHELRYADYGDYGVICGVEEFITATGLDGSAASMKSRKPYFDLTEPMSGDHYIFMAIEGHHDPSEHDEFSDDQMDWAEGLLAKYSGDGHRIFLIQHSLISGYGAGDDRDDPAYGGSMIADERYPNNLRFKQMIERYRDVIWLSGHTHVDLRDGVNFSDEGGSSCLMFHVPSAANTTRLSYDSDGKRELDRTFYDDTTQGYFMDAYTDAVLICGVNYHDNKLYPQYTYIVGETAEGESPTEPPTETLTESPTEQMTQPSEQSDMIWGDADCDGELTVLDATAIQRDLAKLEQLSDKGLRAAKVNGEPELNIIDATLIQRKLAKLTDSFPVEKSPAATGEQDISAEVSAQLESCRQYASYVEYAELKRAARKGDTVSMNAALDNFIKLKKRVKPTTVYFSDNRGIGHVYAYVWNAASGKYLEPWPGQKATYVRTNSLSENIYAITVDTALYDRIVFSNNDIKTADIPLTSQSGRVYYAISDESPYNVTYSVLRRDWYDSPSDTATVYFTDTQDWGKAYLYWWTDSSHNTWPGDKMTFVRKTSTGKSIYKATIPAGAKVVFNSGSSDNKTVDIPAIADGFGYYPYSKDADGKWQIVEYKY